MKMIKLVVLFTLLCFSYCTLGSNKVISNQVTFIGNWKWERNSDKGEFNISFSQKGDSIIGNYCAIAQAGERIDCFDKGEYSFRFLIPGSNSNQIEFKFRTAYSNTFGKAKITLGNKNLLWEILEKPKGEFYAPLKAVLIKE